MLSFLKNSVFKFILDVIFVIIVLIVGIYTINNKYNVSIFGNDFNIIEDKNMAPYYNTNDLVIVRNIDYNELKLNDVISINDQSTRKIMKIDSISGTEVVKNFVVSNNKIDSKEISYKDINGIVIYKIDGFGKIVNFLRRYFILIIIIFIGITYFTDIKEVE